NAVLRRFKDDVEADTRVVGRAGAGGDDDAVCPAVQCFLRHDGIVADDLYFCAQFCEIMAQVIGEAVVIIYEQDFHTAPSYWNLMACSAALMSAIALLRLSSHSPSPLESA